MSTFAAKSRTKHAQRTKRKQVDWRSYETQKNFWLLMHPGATPDQIEAASREIAKRLEV